MTLQPKTFPALTPFGQLSARSLATHHKLYLGYVRAYNDLARKCAAIQGAAGPLAPTDSHILKLDMLTALSAVKNHELFFDSFTANPGPTVPEPLNAAIVQSFGTLERFYRDLRETAFRSPGWAWTAFDRDTGRLLNIPSTPQSPFPLWTLTPLLAFDLHGHAYLYDYNRDKPLYIDHLLAHIDWSKCATRLPAAQS